MNDKQQIKEMAKVLCYIAKECENCKIFGKCLAFNSAELLYNAGYRKLPENAVVLTRKEYECLKNESTDIAKDYQEMAKFYDEKCEELDQARKETAREILTKVKECKTIKELVELGYIVSYVDVCKEIEELAKQYGVE